MSQIIMNVDQDLNAENNKDSRQKNIKKLLWCNLHRYENHKKVIDSHQRFTKCNIPECYNRAVFGDEDFIR